MKTLTRGTYLGTKVDSLEYDSIMISRAEYWNKEDQDWHCHENPFFAYFLKGENWEVRRTQQIKCLPGTLLFYKPGEPHCNKNYTEGCKIFHIEIDNHWFDENNIDVTKLDVDVINHSMIKNTFTSVMNEFSIRDELSETSIKSLIVYLFTVLSRACRHSHRVPPWASKFSSLINDQLNTKPSLQTISKILHVHPVTLSREFPKYFHCSFGDYIRQLRVEKALPLLARKSIPIDSIALSCGFSDASNFIRTFRKVKGISPNVYRKLM